MLFVGDKGAILTGGAGGTPTLLPESKFKGYAKPKPTLARSKGHHRDWLDACKGGAPASSNFEYGARLTELALLGALALRLGRRVDWDAERMEARGISEAEPIIREPVPGRLGARGIEASAVSFHANAQVCWSSTNQERNQGMSGRSTRSGHNGLHRATGPERPGGRQRGLRARLVPELEERPCDKQAGDRALGCTARDGDTAASRSASAVPGLAPCGSSSRRE